VVRASAETSPAATARASAGIDASSRSVMTRP
jgi:hypothetical protein